MSNHQSISKKLLPVHQSVGTALAAVLYLICLSGAVAVFYPEFERLEQAAIPEFSEFAGESAQLVFDNYQQTEKQPAESVYIVLPTFDQPRAHLSAGGQEWWLSEEGQVLEKVHAPWTDMLKDLHLYLHLPKLFGMIVVSFFGVMLLHLSITGLLSHRRIYKDLFSFRRGGTGQQSTIDLHNRFSVFGLPFSLMIGVTGTFFGMFSIFSMITASATHQGDETKLIEDIYGGDPIVRSSGRRDIIAGFEHLKKLNPEAEPIYVVVQNMDKENEFYEIAATLPGRLIYSEIYRYQSDGTFIDQQGFENGSAGRQVIYSIYRLHFGHFDSYWIKFTYFVLGIGLAIICVSGINIWLNRRGFQTKLNHVWLSFVWGTPISLVISACMAFIGVNQLVLFYWVVLLLIISIGILTTSLTRLKKVLLSLLLVSTLVLAMIFNIKQSGSSLNELTSIFNSVTIIFLLLLILFNKTDLRPFKKCVNGNN
jgi:uncharacterized iron-regulated membrane protein